MNTDLGEIATRKLAKKHNSYGLKQNKEIARRGGRIEKHTRDNFEKELGQSVVTTKNKLDYQYIEKQQIKQMK